MDEIQIRFNVTQKSQNCGRRPEGESQITEIDFINEILIHSISVRMFRTFRILDVHYTRLFVFFVFLDVKPYLSFSDLISV